MENPVEEIPQVIHLLTQSPPTVQKQTLEKFFTEDAQFIHPFCRTGSWPGSRWVLLCIYQWYKILSPKIELDIKSVAFDEKNLLLYVTIFQVFRIWFIPLHSSPVHLTTVLQLTTTNLSAASEDQFGNGKAKRYWITSQNDLYQTDQFVLFVDPLRILYLTVFLFQSLATLCCVVCATVFYLFTWALDNVMVHEKAKAIENKEE